MWTAALDAQPFLRPRYGFAVNNGMAEVLPGAGSDDIKGLVRAPSFYLWAGVQHKRDSLVFEAALRFGSERSRFEKEFAQDVYYFFHAKNRTLSLCLSAGIALSEKHTLFGGLHLVRIFANHEEGGAGVRGNGYQYELTRNTTPECWDPRPCLTWQYCPAPNARWRFHVSIEPSVRRHRGELRNVFISPNFAAQYYSINYQLVILSAGISL